MSQNKNKRRKRQKVKRKMIKAKEIPNELKDCCVALISEKSAGTFKEKAKWHFGDLGCGKTADNKKVFYYWGGKAGNLTQKQVKELHARNNNLRFVRGLTGYYALLINAEKAMQMKTF